MKPAPLDSHPTEPQSSSNWTRRLVVSAVVVSIAWTAFTWRELAVVKQRLSEVALLTLGFALTEVLFIGGAILMAIGCGITVRREGQVTTVRGLLRLRGQYRQLALRSMGSNVFRLGFNVNWIGAVGSGLLVLAGILLVLPVSAWALTTLPLVDVVASIAWRVPARRGLNGAASCVSDA
ncbi:hypothetical protein ACFVFJ_50145 [Streptomyces sp. NPDC057717]|uniref:hypothetical protein n=1 Tax=Streptomyces sp. NPDC057717 TaxID=3346224 RepID=UPI0036A0A9E3